MLFIAILSLFVFFVYTKCPTVIDIREKWPVSVDMDEWLGAALDSDSTVPLVSKDPTNIIDIDIESQTQLHKKILQSSVQLMEFTSPEQRALPSSASHRERDATSCLAHAGKRDPRFVRDGRSSRTSRGR